MRIIFAMLIFGMNVTRAQELPDNRPFFCVDCLKTCKNKGFSEDECINGGDCKGLWHNTVLGQKDDEAQKGRVKKVQARR